MADVKYITVVGLQRIQNELEWLARVERPRIVAEVAYAASLGDRSENAEYIYGKKRLREIDARAGYLVSLLNKIQIVDPGRQTGTKVKFGATVTVVDDDGDEKTWRIYGADEVDIEKGIISYVSPLGKALLGKEEGEAVKFSTPGGKRELEIVAVRFEPQEPLPEPEWKKQLAAD
jgi:transcription elongation factor GreB